MIEVLCIEKPMSDTYFKKGETYKAISAFDIEGEIMIAVLCAEGLVDLFMLGQEFNQYFEFEGTNEEFYKELEGIKE